MTRRIAVVGAPSSIGIRPYDDGEARHLDRAPRVLRDRGLITRLDALDMGDVFPPAYRDYQRPADRPRNEAEVAAYSRSLGERVAASAHNGRFSLVLGGDCSIVLGCLLAARKVARGPVGLAYLDAHADFASPEESRTGSVASMCLALATGRGDSPLARLGGRAALVDARQVALLGRRDAADELYGHAALAASPILDLSNFELKTRSRAEIVSAALERIAHDMRGFWIHLDADVLSPEVMPAVDSPEPGGLMPQDLVRILEPLMRHPMSIGLSLSLYDPALDADRSAAWQLIHLLETLMAA